MSTSKNDNSGAHPGSGQSGRLPRKRFYRARAHSNPLSDSHFPIPLSPADVDYAHHFPHFFAPAEPGRGNGMALARKVRFADVGCGFGGLLVGLSPLFPDTLMIGMELRDKEIVIYKNIRAPFSSMLKLLEKYRLSHII